MSGFLKVCRTMQDFERDHLCFYLHVVVLLGRPGAKERKLERLGNDSKCH